MLILGPPGVPLPPMKLVGGGFAGDGEVAKYINKSAPSLSPCKLVEDWVGVRSKGFPLPEDVALCWVFMLNFFRLGVVMDCKTGEGFNIDEKLLGGVLGWEGATDSNTIRGSSSCWIGDELKLWFCALDDLVGESNSSSFMLMLEFFKGDEDKNTAAGVFI